MLISPQNAIKFNVSTWKDFIFHLLIRKKAGLEKNDEEIF